jgi:hypothetical protein
MAGAETFRYQEPTRVLMRLAMPSIEKAAPGRCRSRQSCLALFILREIVAVQPIQSRERNPRRAGRAVAQPPIPPSAISRRALAPS